MCGIAGFTHAFKQLPPSVLTSALASIDHRGPDHQGRFHSSQISLGATRLRILDLDSGDQPLISPDGDVVLVFNGEIFNYKELRAELVKEGFGFATECDTEVVLNAFLRWGLTAFARLRGMFALAVWMQSERRLVLARDRMGIKPLYYYHREGELYFGSELKCILAHPAVPRKLSLAGLNTYLSLNYVPGPSTLVEGITKLMPGQLLEWSAGRCKLIDYVPPASVEQAPTSVEDAADELDGLLSQAVKEQLVSDRPLGLWLSGGLDSSSVLHYAAQASSHPIQTFSVTFKGRSGDESEHIHKISRHFGTNHHELDLNETWDLAGAIEQIAYYSDEPSADAGAVPTWFLSKMTRQHATVALSGEGSDELFAGYLTYRADRYSAWSRAIPSALRRAALACALRIPASDERISFEYKLKRFLQGSLLPPDSAHVFWNGTFSEKEKQELFRFADPTAMPRLLRNMHGSGLQRYLNFDQRYYLADDILYKVDRMSMAHSIEVRPPFLDPRIVDFAARLPEHFKLHGSTSKYVLRQTMKGKLPEFVLRGPKVGFDIPVHEWFRGVLRPFLLETLSQESVESTNLFHWPTVERLIDEHLTRRANVGYHLWGLMVLLLWMKRWKIESPSESSIPTALVEALDGVGWL
jgi:asparagine synthase (glutamine-hydrolysing)